MSANPTPMTEIMSENKFSKRWEEAHARKETAEEAYREECREILADLEASIKEGEEEPWSFRSRRWDP